MRTYQQNTINKVKRGANKATYDRVVVHKILDDTFLCHLAYIYEGRPIIIPTAYGREEEVIYIHGAIANRMMKGLLEVGQASLTVTHLDGLVLSRSAFDHSANYRSVAVFGKVKIIEKAEDKMHALRVIMDHIIPDRWDECRLPNKKELNATLVIAIEIEYASAKIRQGGPVDNDNDYLLPHWAGHIPIRQVIGAPIPDKLLMDDIEIPESAINFQKSNNDA